RKNLGWPEDKDFYIPDEALTHFREAVEAGSGAQREWQQQFDAWSNAYPKLAKQFADGLIHMLPAGWDSEIPAFGVEEALATRASAGKALNSIAKNYPALFGGSADLNSSTDTVVKDAGDFESPDAHGEGTEGSVGGGWSYAGRNPHFGVREHAMGSA